MLLTSRLYFCKYVLSTNYQSPGWPPKGRAHTGQSTHLHIWCFNFALHSDTFPPNNHHATSSLARKITSTAKIRQPTPKNRHDGEMVLSKIKLHQSFKQWFFQVPTPEQANLSTRLDAWLVNTNKLEFIQSSDPYKSVPKAGQLKSIQGRIQP